MGRRLSHWYANPHLEPIFLLPFFCLSYYLPSFVRSLSLSLRLSTFPFILYIVAPVSHLLFVMLNFACGFALIGITHASQTQLDLMFLLLLILFLGFAYIGIALRQVIGYVTRVKVGGDRWTRGGRSKGE